MKEERDKKSELNSQNEFDNLMSIVMVETKEPKKWNKEIDL